MIDTAYILAGGRSLRLGRDKRFLNCDGGSLLMRMVKCCREVFPIVKLVAKQTAGLVDSGCEVVLDWPDADGPMAGVIAALQDSARECCFVTAVDLYDLNSRILLQLLEGFDDQQYLGVKEPEGEQPLCGIYNRSALAVLIREGKAGNFRMRDIIAGLNHDWLPLSGAPWRNINRPQDLTSIGANNG